MVKKNKKSNNKKNNKKNKKVNNTKNETNNDSNKKKIEQTTNTNEDNTLNEETNNQIWKDIQIFQNQVDITENEALFYYEKYDKNIMDAIYAYINKDNDLVLKEFEEMEREKKELENIDNSDKIGNLKKLREICDEKDILYEKIQNS